MKRIYFVRHGETEWNRLRKIQGQADNPLNERGRQEARQARELLEEIPFGLCFTSPLGRAAETAEILLAGSSCPVLREDMLTEISYGVDEGQSIDRIYQDEALPLHHYFTAPEYYTPPPGGETIESLFARCREFLSRLQARKEELPDDILVTCHGGVIRGMICVVQGLSQKDFWRGKEQPNCGLTIIEYGADGWKLMKEAENITKGGRQG